jgi:hypothetical protein
MSILRTLLLVAGLSAAGCGAQAQDMLARVGTGVRASVPTPEMILIMARSTLMMVGQANQTANYSILRALASKNFRERNSEAVLSEAFAKVRGIPLDYWSVAALVPVFSDVGISDGGLLRLIGHVPTRPVEMTFQLVFAAEDGGWRLDGVGIGARNMAPVPVAAATAPAGAGQGVAGVGAALQPVSQQAATAQPSVVIASTAAAAKISAKK